MIGKLDEALQFQADALKLRSYRQELLASNVANADTPNYKAVDFDFAAALANAAPKSQPLATTAPGHIAGTSPVPSGVQLQYRKLAQPSLDGNSVDLDVERAQFVDNAVRYEAAVRFLNEQIRSLTTVLKDN